MELIGKIKNKFQAKFENVLDYILPKECLGCTKEGEYLCSSCFSKIKYIEKIPCFICNQEGFTQGICPSCQNKTQIDKIIVATTFTGNMTSQLVEQLKYSYIQDISVILAKILYGQLKVCLDFDLIDNVWVPIPLHKKRLAERGFNQSEVILESLVKYFGQTVEKNLLLRKKNTLQQAKLERLQRLENLKDAFILNLNKKVPEKVVLFDDVLTTGTTFVQAVKVLKSHGVKKVCCVAVCHG